MSKRSKKAAPEGSTAPEGAPAAPPESSSGTHKKSSSAAAVEAAQTAREAAREQAVDAELEAAAKAAETEVDEAVGEAAAADGAAGEPGTAPAAEAPKKRAKAQLPPPPPERLVGAIEALLLASGDVLTAERLRDVLGLASAIHVREAIEQVRQRWAAAGLSVELQEVAGGVRVVTRPEFAEYVRRMQRHVSEGKLSQGLLETLSIVAYRQPVARPEIERIRGVQVGEALRALLERRLIKVTGRSDQPGRPMLYGTTTRFLTSFGLNDLKDLPSAKDLARL